MKRQQGWNWSGAVLRGGGERAEAVGEHAQAPGHRSRHLQLLFVTNIFFYTPIYGWIKKHQNVQIQGFVNGEK